MMGRSDDPDANAILGAYGAVSDVLAGDRAMDNARKNGDAAAMDQVIQQRPHDWTYRSSRAILALSQGDLATYESQGQAVNDLAQKEGIPAGRLARQIIVDYQTFTIPETGAPCARKYSDLSNAYQILYEETGDEAYLANAMVATDMMVGCQ